MKIPALFFVLGAAAGAAVVWFGLPSREGDSGSADSPPNSTAGGSSAVQKLSAKIQTLEKELKQAKSGSGKTAGVTAADEPKPNAPRVFAPKFDESHIEDMMRQQAEREASREADRLALRLKLTPEQKESLRKFLVDSKAAERAVFQTAMKNGGKAEPSKPAQSKDDFLQSLLTPEQQTEYARSREEQRTAQAEEYAQRKVRRLNNDLNLSEEQKDKLFQAYARQKLAATDPAKQTATGDVVAQATGGAISITSSVGGIAGEPIAFDLDIGDMLAPGRGELDRPTMESILTPEQMAVYDQRQAEAANQSKSMIQIGSPDGVESGAVIRFEKAEISDGAVVGEPPATKP